MLKCSGHDVAIINDVFLFCAGVTKFCFAGSDILSNWGRNLIVFSFHGFHSVNIEL